MNVQKIELTERQQEVVDVIAESIRVKGSPPTVREIGEAMNIKSSNGVMCHLHALERKGVIERDAFSSRGIRLVDYVPELLGNCEGDDGRVHLHLPMDGGGGSFAVCSKYPLDGFEMLVVPRAVTCHHCLEIVRAVYKAEQI